MLFEAENDGQHDEHSANPAILHTKKLQAILTTQHTKIDIYYTFQKNLKVSLSCSLKKTLVTKKSEFYLNSVARYDFLKLKLPESVSPESGCFKSKYSGSELCSSMLTFLTQKIGGSKNRGSALSPWLEIDRQTAS